MNLPMTQQSTLLPALAILSVVLAAGAPSSRAAAPSVTPAGSAPASAISGPPAIAPSTAGKGPAGSRKAAASTVQPLALLPGTTDAVLSIDFATLRKSDMVAEIESRIDSIPDARENYTRFVEETGLDPRNDLDSILIARRPGAVSDRPEVVVIATGRFGASRLMDRIAAEGGTASIYDGFPTVAAPEGAGTGDRQGLLARPDDGTLLFGSAGLVRGALDVLAGNTEPERKGETMRRLLGGVDRAAPVWAAFDSRSVAGRISQSIQTDAPGWNPGAALSSIAGVRVSAWAGKSLDFKIQLDAKDAESASLLADAARGALAAAKLQARNGRPELLPVLQEVTIALVDAGVEITAHVPASMIRPAGN